MSLDWSDEFKAEMRRAARDAVKIELAAREIANKPFVDPDPGDATKYVPPVNPPIFPKGREAHEIDTWKMRYEREHIHALNLKQRNNELEKLLEEAKIYDWPILKLETKGT